MLCGCRSRRRSGRHQEFRRAWCSELASSVAGRPSFGGEAGAVPSSSGARCPRHRERTARSGDSSILSSGPPAAIPVSNVFGGAGAASSSSRRPLNHRRSACSSLAKIASARPVYYYCSPTPSDAVVVRPTTGTQRSPPSSFNARVAGQRWSSRRSGPGRDPPHQHLPKNKAPDSNPCDQDSDGRVVASLSCGEPCFLFVASGRAPPRSDVKTCRRDPQLDRSMEERRPTDTTPAAPSSTPTRETSTTHNIRAECSGRALSYSCARRKQRRRVLSPGNWWVPRRRGHLGWSWRERRCSDGS